MKRCDKNSFHALKFTACSPYSLQTQVPGLIRTRHPMTQYIFVAVGIAVLVFGGDILVRGAVSLAERLAIPPLVIGLTIVSFGTSAPELFISADAALVGLGGLAVGNVVGSNIANILLVLGLPALFMKTPCAGRAVDRNIMIMIGLTLVFMAMLYFDPLRWHDGIILLILLGLFLREQYVTATSGGTSVLVEAETESDKLANATRPCVEVYRISDSGHRPVAAWRAPHSVGCPGNSQQFRDLRCGNRPDRCSNRNLLARTCGFPDGSRAGKLQRSSRQCGWLEYFQHCGNHGPHHTYH